MPTTKKKAPAKRSSKVPASKKYADRTTYKDLEGKEHKRVSHPGTQRGYNYCARSFGQKKTDKVKARRSAWGVKASVPLGS